MATQKIAKFVCKLRSNQLKKKYRFEQSGDNCTSFQGTEYSPGTCSLSAFEDGNGSGESVILHTSVPQTGGLLGKIPSRQMSSNKIQFPCAFHPLEYDLLDSSWMSVD